MGDRYTLTMKCPRCGHEDDDVWYAPTSGFMTWECQKCNKVVDLEEYSGIDAEGTANTEYGVKTVRELKRKLQIE